MPLYWPIASLFLSLTKTILYVESYRQQKNCFRVTKAISISNTLQQRDMYSKM